MSKKPNEYNIQTDYPLFAQIPQDLLRDPNMPDSAVRLYGVYHTYAPRKDLRDRPDTFVSQETIAGVMGKSRKRVSYWTRYIHEKGWVTIERRGLTKSNIITLHAKQKKRR